MGYPDYFCLFLPIFDISIINYAQSRTYSKTFSLSKTIKIDVLSFDVVEIIVGLDIMGNRQAPSKSAPIGNGTFS